MVPEQCGRPVTYTGCCGYTDTFKAIARMLGAWEQCPVLVSPSTWQCRDVDLVPASDVQFLCCLQAGSGEVLVRCLRVMPTIGAALQQAEPTS